MLGRIQVFVIMSCFSVCLACATSNDKKVESEWSDLDRVGAISCNLWPLKEGELDVSNMSATSAANGGVVATIRMRNGSVSPSFVETKGSAKVSVDDLKSFPIGRDAVVIAIGEWKKQAIAFIVQNKNDRGWLEIRGIADNRLISRMSTPVQDDVSFGKIALSSKGWWLQLNHGEIDASFVHVTPDSSPNWKFSLSSFQSHSRFATLASSNSSDSTHVVEQLKTNDSQLANFSITQLEVGGKFANTGKISIPSNGGVESWSAVGVKNRINIAMVRGDSMIGQGVVVVVGLSLGASGPAVEWKKEFAYPDVHLGEPVWLTNGTVSLLGMIKWIDAEGSLSRIKVEALGAELLSDVGVFPKGTVMAAGYLNDKSVGLGAFRYRENDLWKYKLCRLAL